jgi:7,8-dihydropterin-6-yl-methyl-4-(beta-D-ribofuranosyl)aminobenzene 5'-phosphate synthase
MSSTPRSFRSVALTALACFVAAAACAPAPITRSPVQHRADSATNVYDAFGRDHGATLDWGFAAVIRYRTHTILFDSGNDAAIFAKNVAALGVDLRDVDIAVLSHAHSDHSAGMDHLIAVNPRARIYLPDDASLGAPISFPIASKEETHLPPERRYFGGRQTEARSKPSGRYWHANVEFVGESRALADGISLVATESPLLGTFSKYPPFEKEPRLHGLPELSLVLEEREGDVLVVGCSHSGIELIVAETKRFRGKAIDLVMGGFHLLPYARADIRALATKLKNELGVRRVAPAHCTGAVGFEELAGVYGDGYMFAGLGETIPLEAPR